VSAPKRVEEAEDEAVAALEAGLVVAVPTDTVYGLAVAPFVAGAVDRLFALKERPRDVSIAVLVDDVAQAETLTVPFPPSARRLAEEHWPGGLTIVLPKRDDVTLDIGGDGLTVGVRAPDHDFVRRLCRRLGPLATTSAHRHREPTLPDAAGIAATFGAGVALVVDGGTCAGAPSTVVRVTGAGGIEVLRQGAITVS
jgi:tRNA threonylcarbamoyl adenosine modification protein (Sua5/YciO/YrdC/YwlC family)